MTKMPSTLRTLSLTVLATLSLGGCYYGDVNGASYADADCDSRYGDQYWSNDPYAYQDGYYGYDCYDAADYRTGFVQIGFGGGWYDSLYYPGHGLFLFDRYGRRHNMGHDHLSYWGGRRAWWKHHGHRGYDRAGHRGHDRGGHGPRPGRGYGHDGSPGHDGARDSWRRNPGAAPPPRERPRGEGRRDRSPGRDNWAPPAEPATRAEPATPAEPARRVPRYNVPPREWNNDSGARPLPDPRAEPAPRYDPAPRPEQAPRPEPAPRIADPGRGYTPPPPPAPVQERPAMRGRSSEGGIRED